MPKIAVISDTHGLLRENAVSILQTCDAVLHAGDFNTPQLYAQLQAIAPLYAVCGNADKEWAAHLPQTLAFELFGIRFYMIHNRKQLRETTADRDIIIYGHSHKYEQIFKNSQVWLNPGSCGSRRFSLPVTMAVITITDHADFTITRIDLADRSAAEHPDGSAQNMMQIIRNVMKETDKGKPTAAIAESCHISESLAEQICRLYLTHPGVTADGILAKMGY